MEKPYLSVIIPVYNGSKFLRETILSVLQQPCKDFELLLLNDGSTDDSLAICESFLGRSENERPLVKLFSQQNTGVSKTRNKGINLSCGDAIIFMDQDDAMRSDFYTEERKRQLAEVNHHGVDMIMNGLWNGNETLDTGTFMSIEKELNRGVYPGRSKKLMWNFLFVFHANIFFRSLFFRKDAPTPVRFFELALDVESSFRQISKFASRKILVSDEFSFSVRRNNSTSVSSTWDWLKVYPVKANAYYEILQWYRQYYPQDEKIMKEAKIWLLKKIDELIEGYSDAQKDAEIDAILKSSPYFSELNSLRKEFPFRSWLLFMFLSGEKYKIYLKCRKTLKRIWDSLKEKFVHVSMSEDKPVITLKGNLLKF